MRTRIAIWAGAVAVVASTLLAASGAQAQVTLNGKRVDYRGDLFAIGQFVMAPLRETLSALEVSDVTWDPHGLSARFGFRGSSVTIRAESGYALVNDEEVPMGVPAVMRRGRLYVPLFFLRDQFGVSTDVAQGALGPGVRVLGFRGTPGVLRRQPGNVGIGGANILVLHAQAEFSSVEERAIRVTERLTAGLQRAMQLDRGAFQPSRVTLANHQGMPTIFVAGVELVSVTADDAAANNMDQDTLAQVWLRQIRARLDQVFPQS